MLIPPFFIYLLDYLPNKLIIFKGRNSDLRHLMKIQCAKYEEKKLAKKKNIYTAFFFFLFSLISYLYADLENWLAAGISGCVS